MSSLSYFLLARVYRRKKPRKDWLERWLAAVRACHGEGIYFPKKNEKFVMAARKDSPVWKWLARGAGGFRDAFGRGKPPFAYGSGMGWLPFDPTAINSNNQTIKQSNAPVALYYLAKKVHQRQDRTLLPSDEAISSTAARAMLAAIRSEASG